MINNKKTFPFEIKGKKFWLSLPDCYEIQHGAGTCPVRKKQLNVECYCTKLLKELIATDFKMHSNFPYVVKCKNCNVYHFLDGQHRACIMGNYFHEEPSIKIECEELTEIEGPCSFCGPIVNDQSQGFIKDFSQP